MSRIYIGGLPPDASRREVEREFEYFGHLRDVWVARNPPGFGFIVYDDQRDAEDAVREMDGRRVCGSRVRVEFARGPTRGGGGGGGGARSRGGGGGRDNSCYECGRVGHTARQCTRKGEFDRGGSSRRRRSRSRSLGKRSYSKSPRRSRSRSRSRSKNRREKGKRRSTSRSRSDERKRSRSLSKEHSRKRSRSRSRSPKDRSHSHSPSPDKDDMDGDAGRNHVGNHGYHNDDDDDDDDRNGKDESYGDNE